MNIDTEWKILANTSARKIRAGSTMIEHETICSVDDILKTLLREHKNGPTTLQAILEKLHTPEDICV